MIMATMTDNSIRYFNKDYIMCVYKSNGDTQIQTHDDEVYTVMDTVLEVINQINEES